MSDTTTPGAAPSSTGSALSLPQAVQMLAERRAEHASKMGAEHASKMGAAREPDGAPSDPASVVTMPETLPIAASEPQPTTPSQADAPATDEAASIVVDGVALTADDIRRGYMRQADYSRKTQALAASSKNVEAERNVKLARLDQLIGALETQQPAEPNWVELARKDPMGWVQKKVQWDNHRTALESAQRISAAMRADVMEREKRAMAADLAATDYPHWQDPRAMTHDLRELAAYAQAQGFTAEEFNEINQARTLRTLDKARRWDELQRQKPLIAKRLAVKPQVQRPGAKPTVAAHQRSLSSAWERFLKNPTVENGAAYQRSKREAASARRSYE